MNPLERIVTQQVKQQTESLSLPQEGAVVAALRVSWRDAYRYWYYRYYYFYFNRGIPYSGCFTPI